MRAARASRLARIHRLDTLRRLEIPLPRPSLFPGLLLTAALLSRACPAWAQSADEKRAETLFHEGRALVEKGDLAAGCAKYVESLAIVKRAGPMVNLAQCDERRGDLLAALQHWRLGISLLPAGDERIAPAREREVAIDRRIPRVQLVLDAGVPREARIAVDGVEIPFEVAGAPRPLNPGSHTISVSAPGRPAAQVPVTLTEGQILRVPITLSPADQPEASGSGLRTAGFVVTGVGAASLLIGAVTGGLAAAKKGAVNDNCVGGCNDAARDAATAGKAFATASTVTFIAGAAAAAAGVTMILISRPRAAVSATLAPSPSGAAISIQGRF